MIRNIVFDIGMVLVDFRWKSLMEELGFTGDRLEGAARATVLGPYWNEFDRSEKSGEEIRELCCQYAPEYEREIRTFFEHIGEICREYPESADWLRSYKEKGYKVYLLSNYARMSFTRATPPFFFLSVVDGGVISYEVQKIKPEPGIYHALLEKYGLKAAECAFVDDNAANIAAARALGFAAVQHVSREETCRRLAELGVR